jgi:hypothetical protein
MEFKGGEYTMSTVILIFSIFSIFSTLNIYIKTNNALVTAFVWAIVIGIIALVRHEISYELITSPISFLMNWGTFTLATYWEENLLLRLLVLIFTMFMMLVTLQVVS